MKVTLLEYTGSPDPERAIDLLIFTKNTRLQMSPGMLNDIASWPTRKKLDELEYMANSVPSSWEFVNYAFLIEGVSRGFTHQFVRSRHASFAQQSMRVTDVSSGPGWEYLTGPTISQRDEDDVKASIYRETMGDIADAYKELVAAGAAIEDARGILPTNILTNIVMGCNMRTFVELVRKRSSPRTQGEYRDVLEAMKVAVREVHPWIDLFVNRTADAAMHDLDDEINGIEDNAKRLRMLKLVDMCRGQL
jgi:flavin-dependent thymidylate synthase